MPSRASSADAAAFRESAEELYEQAPCGYLSTTADGVIVRVNQTFLDWTGYTRAELTGRRRFVDLLAPGGRIYHETHYAPLLRMQGTVREIALDVVTARGGRLPVLVNSVLHPATAERPEVIRTTVFNATDRQRYEHELQVARRRVERLQRLTAALAAATTAREVEEAAARELAASFGARDVALVAAAAAPDDRVAVPLTLDDRAVGELRLRLDAEPPPDERALLGACAAQCAQALERARLYERERSVASSLQQSLLAGDPPRDPRYEIALHYRPAYETLEVGGDWYDAFPLDGTTVAVTVGDVAGRGIGAATAMGQLRSAVRALGLERRGPAHVLERLEDFATSMGAAQMATVAYAEIELDAGRMVLACAGHPPPALLEPGSPARFLWGGRSAPVGVGTAAIRAEAEVDLNPGSGLLLYTDGLVERRSRPIDADLDRLLAELAERRDRSPAALVHDLTDRMLADEGGRDDVCVLYLRLT